MSLLSEKTERKIMKSLLLAVLMLIGFFGAVSQVSAQTASGLNGKYVLEQTLENGQTNQIAFELKAKNVAVYSKANPAMEEFQARNGSWIWNRSSKSLTVTMPSAANDSAKVVVTFKLDGENLKVFKVSPASAGKVGDVFKKL
jgi:frataxin-like iron-binding protein CyaY